MKRHEQKRQEIKRAIKRVKMGEKAWGNPSFKKASKQNLPTIKVLAEREVKMIELDVDIPSDAKNALLEMARKNILKDEKALLNWAFVRGIEYGIEHCKKTKK